MYYIRIALAVAGMMLFAGCEKDTAYTIPQSVAGTRWESGNVDGEYFSLVFESDKCTLIKTEPSQGMFSTTIFDYRYDRPELVLTEPSNSEVVLTGKIWTDGKSYLIMDLNNADNSFALSLWFVKQG